MKTQSDGQQFAPYYHKNALSELESTFAIFAGTVLGPDIDLDDDEVLRELGKRATVEKNNYNVANFKRLADSIDKEKDIESELKNNYFGFSDPETRRQYKDRIDTLYTSLAICTELRPDIFWKEKLHNAPPLTFAALEAVPETGVTETGLTVEEIEKFAAHFIASTLADLYVYFWQSAQAIRAFLKLTSSSQESNIPEAINTAASPSPRKEPKLSHARIAILYHINHWPITDNNAEEIARRYGQTSGQKLKTTYDILTSQLERTRKGKYTVENYEHIKNLVLDKHKPQYDRELKEAIKNNKK